ncbi:MAG: B12-binding domain-containing radical SAM protein [Bacteroidetes bacterium]|nr:B12-binding domain-containing radical SAM protein [Bacteroidota bacterium]MBU1115694.1 B12-binding domain-containing radical SAM protein [Bacteroidota bacterium]MBU1799949.1 B12-binding domain-containing radical SAM protein [Bacteroidota bacterium]
MKILLLYPEMPDTFYAFKHLTKVIGKKAAFPPVGLLTVAAMLPKHWELKVVDINVTKLSDNEILWADLVFISAMNTQAQSTFECIKECKKLGAIIVAGGPLFTHEYERFPDVDYFVLNEAELTLPVFLKDLNEKSLKRIYSTKEFANVHETPIPKWELINMNDYAYSTIQYTRGCPYFCDFCDVTTLFGRKPRVKTPKQIINELDAILKNGNPDMILFADDNLIGNKGQLKKELLPELIKWRDKNKYAPGFDTQATINLADDEELMQEMLEAGFRKIFVGIESLDEEILLQIRKNQNAKRDLVDTINKLHKRGFMINGAFIVGLDNDKPSVFQNIINFVSETSIVLVIVNMLKAPVGTELYDKMLADNRIIKDLDFDENKSNLIHKMDKVTLDAGYAMVLEELYSPRSIYKRAKSFLLIERSTKVKNGIRRKITYNGIIMAIKTISMLGFRDENRFYFWRLIIWTIFKSKLSKLDLAIFFSALMFQYNQMHKSFLKQKDYT